MRRPSAALAGLLLLVSGSEVGAAPEPPPDLLTLAEGAVLVSASANASAALALTDGDPKTSWSDSGPRTPGPHTFVFELRAPTTLARVGVDNPGARPRGGGTAPARAVVVEGSAESATAGFVPLATFEAAPDGETLVDVTPPGPVRWLRFTFTESPGADWLYVDEVVAHGTQTAPAAANRFTGVFETGLRSFLELKQDGTTLTGCYVEQSGHAVGTVSGDVVDGVARLAWRSTVEGVHGVALLVVDSRGHVNGVRYRDRSRSIWSGGPAPAGTTTPCSADAAPANPIADALAGAGEARIYGILFDFDSATLQARSEPALRQLLGALEAQGDLRVVVAGHTDALGDDAYNLTLSTRRAQAVVTWLTGHGIGAERLEPVGRGEGEPVATNATADGRALNRRVDVVKR